MNGRAWFETARTGLADPVLRQRLASAGLDPKSPEVAGFVFDMVTGGRSLEEALRTLSLPANARAVLETELLREPDLEELQHALRSSGRDAEAARMVAMPSLEGGEYEARAAGSGPARVSSGGPVTVGAFVPPKTAVEPVPEHRPVDTTAALKPESQNGGLVGEELRALRHLLEQRLNRGPEVHLRALEARIDQLAATLKLTCFVGVAVLVVLALSS